MNPPKNEKMKCQVFEGLMAMVRVSDSGSKPVLERNNNSKFVFVVLEQ